MSSIYQDQDGMTLKQRLFCEHYLANGYNATQAVRDAGYKCKKDVFRCIATENLSKPIIKQYLGERMKEAIEKVGVGIEYRLKVVKDVIGACMDGSASKDCVVYADGALKGVAELNKMTGDYAPTKTETKDTSDPCEGMDTLIAQSKNEY
jgi:phage terminase small subunit